MFPGGSNTNAHVVNEAAQIVGSFSCCGSRGFSEMPWQLHYNYHLPGVLLAIGINSGTPSEASRQYRVT
jgi:hypothetical protein